MDCNKVFGQVAKRNLELWNEPKVVGDDNFTGRNPFHAFLVEHMLEFLELGPAPKTAGSGKPR